VKAQLQLRAVDRTTALLVLLPLRRTSFDVAQEAFSQLAGVRSILCLQPLALEPHGYPIHQDLLAPGWTVDEWTAMVGLLRGSGFVPLIPVGLLAVATDQSLVCVSHW
jgi:hypothetical protein